MAWYRLVPIRCLSQCCPGSNQMSSYDVTGPQLSQTSVKMKECSTIWRNDYFNLVSMTHLVQGSLCVCPANWETTLQCNFVSHFLGAGTEWFLLIATLYMHWDGGKLSLISFGSASGLVPFGDNQLLEPILTQVSLSPYDVIRPRWAEIVWLILSCLWDLTHWLG